MPKEILPKKNYEVAAANKAPNLVSELYTGMVEQTHMRSGYVFDSMKMPYNPDDIYQKRGNYSIYEEMLNDDQVSICSNLKKDLVLGSGYQIIPQDDSQSEICNEIEELLEECSDQGFSDKLRELLDAYEMGFSLTEKVFKTLPDGKLALKDLLTRHPNSWLIYQDPQGRITKYEQKSTVKGDLDIDPKSLIHYINNGKYQNPYGKSDLRPAYNAWFVKRQVIRWFGIFLESSAKPIPVGKYDSNAPEGTADDLLEILKAFQAKTAITIPKEIVVEFLEAKSNGEAFHKAINIFNMFIGRSMFIPDLLGMSGGETGGGSLALGKEQMNVFFMHINRRRASLEKIINKHIIKPLVLYNYGDIPVPKFQFNPLDDSLAIEYAKVWLQLVQTKSVTVTEEEVNHFRKLVKFPEAAFELVLNPALQKPEDEKEEEDSEENGSESEKEDEEKPEKEEEKEFSFKLPKGSYHKKVNFKAIKDKLNDYDKSLIDETQPIVKKMFADMYEQIKKKNILNNKDISKVDSINLKYRGELKKAIYKSFLGIFKDGQIQGAAELNKQDFALPTTSEEFLELLDKELFTYIGKYEYDIKNRVRQELVAAIKDGLPLSNVIDVMNTDGMKLSQVSLERFARTKHTEVLNRGRHEFFEKSGVVAAYQYSAVLDDRTSDICAGLDGKIFEAGTEPIPPMHFNCRSLLIPITKYEDYKADTKVGSKNIDDFIDENKGDGFSRFSSCGHDHSQDEDLDFETKDIGENVEKITYFKNKKPVEAIVITYSDYTKTKVLSKKTEKLNESI